ncbi:MAG: phosphoribosylanthranilate isomerase [Deltaproteobacteria bacterium]|nr:phosphoribosylanthranilate isomerase [Deltaproteobacteria bacterium]
MYNIYLMTGENRVPVIKVCGIQNINEALGSVEAGANTIGMLLGITHTAEDKITNETGKGIVDALPAGIRTVMVTNLLDADEIRDIAKEVGISAVQIHDDLGVLGIKKLRELLPGIELIKAIHVTGEEALQQALQYAPHVDRLLLDSRTKDRLGGTGQTHDWSISRRIVEAVDKPVILAGGLNPGNIESAIERVMPYGIDANSGLENEDGSKDFDKVLKFTQAGAKLRMPSKYEKNSQS